MTAAVLAELDCLAADGDPCAAVLARWCERHPNGPRTPEDHAEEAAVRHVYERVHTPQGLSDAAAP